MTARFEGAAYEDLLAAAMYGHSLGEAQKLIDDFAHELAEQLREEGGVVQCEFDCHKVDADLIDPQAA